MGTNCPQCGAQWNGTYCPYHMPPAAIDIHFTGYHVGQKLRVIKELGTCARIGDIFTIKQLAMYLPDTDYRMDLMYFEELDLPFSFEDQDHKEFFVTEGL